MAVRAKMLFVEMRLNSYNTTQVIFSAMYDPTIPEDRRFQKATPSARAEFTIDNPEALAQFQLGRSYYVDFTPVPEPEAATNAGE